MQVGAAYVAYPTHVVASQNALLRPEEAAAKVKRIWRLAEATRQSGAYALETKNNMKTKQLRMRRAVLGAPKPLRTPHPHNSHLKGLLSQPGSQRLSSARQCILAGSWTDHTSACERAAASTEPGDGRHAIRLAMSFVSNDSLFQQLERALPILICHIHPTPSILCLLARDKFLISGGPGETNQGSASHRMKTLPLIETNHLRR